MIELLKRHAVWLVFLLAVVFAFIFIHDHNESVESAVDEMQAVIPPGLEQADTSGEETDVGKVIVDIKGEVHHPGVYEMDGNDRIHHVIDAAGGFTDEADQTKVNLAQRVQDEMVIAIPKQGEADGMMMSEGVAGDAGGGVRVNYADQAEIETLSGIGPSKAEAIIKHREENGHFQRVEDLLEVSGIGEKTLENLRDQIIIP